MQEAQWAWPSMAVWADLRHSYHGMGRPVIAVVSIGGMAPLAPVYGGTTTPYAIGLYCLTMNTSLLPQLTAYGAALLAAAILGYWPELIRFKQSLHDRTAFDGVRRVVAHLRRPSFGDHQT